MREACCRSISNKGTENDKLYTIKEGHLVSDAEE